MEVPITTNPFETCIDFGLEIGESPVWDPVRSILWFVDILRPAIYSLDPISGVIADYRMPCEVGSIGMANAGLIVVALRSGIHLFDPATQRLDFLVHPEPEMTMNRLNDGKVGPDGCFWVGSMHDAVPRALSGALHRITPDGRSRKVLDGLYVSNGLAWSPDGRTMYHADSRGPFIQAFDFDATTGAISNGRMIALLDEMRGLPDGAAVDQEGTYWSAGVSAGRLNRITPDGFMLDPVEVPLDAPTMPCFGGSDLRTLFVTSLSTITSDKTSSGSLISFRVTVPGTPVGQFGSPG
ncbi:SMP-30/gluconolactonase/LRE family protein [Mesorhizobium sp. B2-1-8]|uniref:SMP-30/gluconolactonase/LRE family protein n=1 Tax=Mesorhizobium sp. B2-1-8 TaxID=2589967 RepID=UPI0011281195